MVGPPHMSGVRESGEDIIIMACVVVRVFMEEKALTFRYSTRETFHARR